MVVCHSILSAKLAQHVLSMAVATGDCVAAVATVTLHRMQVQIQVQKLGARFMTHLWLYLFLTFRASHVILNFTV